MNIIVSIKQVPGTTEVRIDPRTNTLIREGVESIINPFDMYALEEGIRLKEKTNGKVTAVTMGPPQAEQALRQALALGVDDGILISDRAFAGSDTWATSYALSAAIKKIGPYDLIICGKQAMDGDTAQVGPGIAVHLDIPYVAWIRKIEEIKHDRIKVERLMEDGYDILEMSLPALITVVKEINTPRMESLKNKMRAKKAVITTWSAADIGANPDYCGLKGSPTTVVRTFVPKREGKHEIIQGATTAEKVVRLVEKIRPVVR